MISKELLSEVIDKEIVSTPTVYDNEVEVYFTLYYFDNIGSDGVGEPTSSTEVFYINIHELAHKVKEWAHRRCAYTILSGICEYRDISVRPEKRSLTYFCDMGFGVSLQGWIGHVGNDSKRVYAITEPEAIFKAGQWILENR